MKTEIHQIFYREDQRAHLDTVFLPFNNKDKKYPYNFEYAVFFEIYKNVDWKNTDLLGTVSWKFIKKTGVPAEVFIKHIETHPNMDVYFVNPFPELSIYPNIWNYGETSHPGLISLTSELLTQSEYIPKDVLNIKVPPNLISYCNYWVANKKFWDAYISFLTPIWNVIKNDNSDLMRRLEKPADRQIRAPFTPFIFERLFSSFLALNNFRVSSMPLYSSRKNIKPILRPIYSRIEKVSQLQNLEEASPLDLLAIKYFLKTKNILNAIKR